MALQDVVCDACGYPQAIDVPDAIAGHVLWACNFCTCRCVFDTGIPLDGEELPPLGIPGLA